MNVQARAEARPRTVVATVVDAPLRTKRSSTRDAPESLDPE
jgi:hypothetical protein